MSRAGSHRLHKTFSEPRMGDEYDEDGVLIPGTSAVGWDISFGCRLNFDQFDGGLRFLLSISDFPQKLGVEQRAVTPAQLRSYANQLLALADLVDEDDA